MNAALATSGNMLGIKNLGSVTITLKFWGVEAQNDNSCTQKVFPLGSGNELNNNHALIDKIGIKDVSNGKVYLLIVNTNSTSSTVNVWNLDGWTNGGCTSDDPAGSPDKW